jgi:hypothetical protein
MGLWDSIKEVALKAKCGLGFHSGEAKRVEGAPACQLEQFCPDCKEIISLRRHAYKTEWENSEFDMSAGWNSCQRIRACVHCNEAVTKVVHEGFSTRGKDGQCRVIEECQRCGHQERRGEEHSWIRSYENTGDSRVRVVCTGCRKEELRNFF